ncbi:hypothetical protein HG535_0C05890 [Zygotorulaspora mrakii]|uniref:Major facilitator superfamily (MFS) profile domain-containing protein n=1 Tax=Zygotorulaspora mrakii TaxID=42260 RepID=A0A7H9B0M5_ZYGMR|nr:uncharacterized protein HG535_0C05890 [Zygotorulaspora mrakii]QLG72235.1 hypothetical protein HG535_0C05890 [Zygotorulaspora mrakii]
MGFRTSLINSSKDVRLLWASVFLRLLSYGLTNQVLTLFLNEIHLDEIKIGLFLSLTLVGDVLCSYILTWYADTWGRRRVLIFGATMMMVSGLVFSYSESFSILLLLAIVGVISPSSDEVGPFKSIEEAMLAHLTPHDSRPEIYALHAFFGTVGASLGAVICGYFIYFVQLTKYGQTDLACYKLVFLLYAFIAFLKVIVMLSLSDHTELDGHHHEEVTSSEAFVVDETDPLLLETETVSSKDASRTFSKETSAIMKKLLIIFMIDSLGSGFMTSGWMVFYYAKQFLMSAESLGLVFFVSKIVMAASTFPSSIIARAFGPVKATLLVQIPSGLFSILIPFAEGSLPLSLVLLNLHFATTAMDVTPRQILLTNIIKPKDLTRVMGIVNIGKTMARCIGPVFTGLLASSHYLWLCYIMSGIMVILADFLLGLSFLDMDIKIMQRMSK